MKPDIDDIRAVLNEHFMGALVCAEIDQEALAGELDNLLCDAYFEGQLSVRREIAERGKA